LGFLAFILGRDGLAGKWLTSTPFFCFAPELLLVGFMMPLS
jgi:hypothetical protein